MAFNPVNLRVLSSNGGFAIWHYRTDDYFEDVLNRDPSYFSEAEILRDGDMVIFDCWSGDAPEVGSRFRGHGYVDMVEGKPAVG